MLERFMKEADTFFVRFAPHITIIGFDEMAPKNKTLASYSSFSVPRTGDRIKIDIDGVVRTYIVKHVTHSVSIKNGKAVKGEIYVTVTL